MSSPESSEPYLPTSHTLLNRLRQWNDKRSWEEFVRTYEKLIFSVALKAGMRDHEARDVVQDTLLSVAKEMPDFQYDPERGSFKGWLRMITRRRIADFWRAKGRQVKLAEDFSGDDEPRTSLIEQMPDPASLELDEIWEDEWRKHLMKVAVERVKKEVSSKAFQIFEHVVIQEVPTAEAAKTLGVSAGNIYITKHRVALLLKKEVKRLEKEYEAEAEQARKARESGMKR